MSHKKVSRDAEIRALFSALDRDKNGYVDRRELRAAMKDVGLDLSDGDLDLMMRAAVFKERLFYEDFIRMMTGTVGRLHRKVTKHKAEGRKSEKRSSIVTNCSEEDVANDNPGMRVAFALFDRNGDGLLSRDEIEVTLRSLDISISPQNIQTIIDRVNTNANGKLDFREFRTLVSDFYPCASDGCQPAPALTSTPTSAAAAATSSPVPVPAAAACAPESGCCRNDDLASAAFKVFDKDKDGFLNAADLRLTMKQLGLTLTEEDVKAMMRTVGVGPLGKISYQDFCRLCNNRVAINAEKRNIRRTRSTPRLPKRLEKEMRGVFDIFDLNGDGFITITEVADVLRSMGIDPSIDTIQQIFHQVDLDGNGKIDFLEFLLLSMKYEHPLPAERETIEMFNALDRDRNGFIDPGDLKSSFAGLGIHLTNGDVQVMMDEVGATNNNKIYFNDFEQIFRRNFARRLPLIKSIKALSCGDFVTDSGAVDRPVDHQMAAKELPVAERTEKAPDSRRDQPVSTSVPVPSEHPVSTATEQPPKDKLERPGNSKTSNFKADDDTQNSKAPRDAPEKSRRNGAISSISSNKNNISLLSSRRGSRWESIFTPASVAAFCKISDSSCTTPNTWTAFKIFDRNADGYISKDELRLTMEELGVHLSNDELDGMMREADTNSDSLIDYTEFSKLMKGSFENYAKKATTLHEKDRTKKAKSSTDNSKEAEEEEEAEEIRAAFMVFDMDCNGLIDAGELRMTMTHLGKRFTQTQVEAMIKAVDRNQDGKIDYEEFLEMMQSV